MILKLNEDVLERQTGRSVLAEARSTNSKRVLAEAWDGAPKAFSREIGNSTELSLLRILNLFVPDTHLRICFAECFALEYKEHARAPDLLRCTLLS